MLNEGSRLQNRRRVPAAVPRPARRAKASVRVPSAAHLAWVMLLPEPASSDTARWRGESHVQVHLRCQPRSEEHTSELQSLMRISYAVFCLKKKKKILQNDRTIYNTTIIHKP